VRETFGCAPRINNVRIHYISRLAMRRSFPFIQMALDPKVATPPSGVWYPGKHPLASYASGLPVFRLDHGYEELAFDVPVHNYLVS